MNRTFGNNTIRLLVATVFSQGILLVSAPILSRMYSVASFGVFGVVFSISSILSSVITFKLETVILSEKTDCEALHFVFLASLLSLVSICFLILLSPMIIIFSLETRSFGLERVFLILFISLFIALNLIMQLYFNRKKMYNLIITSYLSMALLNVALSLIFSSYLNGLIYAILGANFTTLLIFIFFWKKELYKIESTIFYRELFIKNFEIPKFAIPASLLNGVINQLPILFINFMFSSTISGYFNLIQRTLGVPAGLFSKSLTVQYRQEVADEIIETGQGKTAFLRYARLFTIISILAFLPILVAGDIIFVFAFGEQWFIAGQIARIYVFAIIVNFVASPLANVLYIAKRNDIDLIWHVTAAVTMLATFLFSWIVKQEFLAYFVTFTCVYGILYIAYYVVCYRVANDPGLKVWRK